MIQQTSLCAYQSIVHSLSNRQAIVYSVLSRKPMNNRELSVFLCLPINSITPRVNELYHNGLIKIIDYKRDSLTGRKTIIWGVTI